jgi:hypothetical protein
MMSITGINVVAVSGLPPAAATAAAAAAAAAATAAPPVVVMIKRRRIPSASLTRASSRRCQGVALLHPLYSSSSFASTVANAAANAVPLRVFHIAVAVGSDVPDSKSGGACCGGMGLDDDDARQKGGAKQRQGDCKAMTRQRICKGEVD